MKLRNQQKYMYMNPKKAWNKNMKNDKQNWMSQKVYSSWT